MTIGVTFRKIGTGSYIPDETGDHVWNGQRIVPKAEGDNGADADGKENNRQKGETA